jgi:hypothetical protein
MTDTSETPEEFVPPASVRRKAIVVVIVIAAALAGALAYTLIRDALESSPALTPYVSATAPYEVSGPGTPTIDISNGAVDGSEIAQTQTSWKTKSTYFVVGTAPIVGGSPSDIDTFFDDTLTGMVAVFPGSVATDRYDSSLDGETAMGGEITVDGSTTFRFVIAAHNGLQYVVLTSGSSPTTEQAFLDSFHFTD